MVRSSEYIHFTAPRRARRKGRREPHQGWTSAWTTGGRQLDSLSGTHRKNEMTLQAVGERRHLVDEIHAELRHLAPL
jgi:hypothetical protein